MNAAGTRVYVANSNGFNPVDSYWYISVIDTATNTIVAHVPAGYGGAPRGIAVNPAGTRVYANGAVIDTATNTQLATIPTGRYGIAVDPTGAKIYSPIDLPPSAVRVIDAATNTLSTTIPVSGTAMAFGQFIGPAAATKPVIEYYAASLDHYFITPLATEIAALDGGGFGGAWKRTGQSFKAWPSATANAVPVCRVFISYPGGSSHFYSGFVNECAAASTAPGAPLFLETPNLMYIQLASASGTCPTGTQPVYRVWSNRADSNHRFTTDAATRDQMIARGWLLEGSGPGFATMCAPQ
jgi:YVTN family beta-propeller protein